MREFMVLTASDRKVLMLSVAKFINSCTCGKVGGIGVGTGSVCKTSPWEGAGVEGCDSRIALEVLFAVMSCFSSVIWACNALIWCVC